MALIVQKYGGTSVADPDRMRAVAENVQITKRHGDDVVVVVSAMGKATDNLIALAGQVSTTRPGREMDMLLTTGERVSAALLTMALADLGVAGGQLHRQPGRHHHRHDARQGEDPRGQGRPGARGPRRRQGRRDRRLPGRQHGARRSRRWAAGASDLTASALAKALDADACEIYTDVTGVFSADPRIVPRARKLARVSFDEMLEMAGAGSKVLALRSVEFARNHGVPLHVRSAFTWEPGTWVTDDTGERDNPREGAMEDPIISGVVTDSSESKVTVLGVPDRPGVSAALFEPLAAANVNVDMIVQNTSTEGTTDISFTMPSADMGVAEDIVSRVAEEIGATGVTHDSEIAKLSVVGAGMRSSPGIAAKMFRTLADEGVNIEMISTSTIRISVVVASADLERAARSLHTAFGLDAGADYAAPLPERR